MPILSCDLPNFSPLPAFSLLTISPLENVVPLRTRSPDVQLTEKIDSLERSAGAKTSSLAQRASDALQGAKTAVVGAAASATGGAVGPEGKRLILIGESQGGASWFAFGARIGRGFYVPRE